MKHQYCIPAEESCLSLRELIATVPGTPVSKRYTKYLIRQVCIIRSDRCGEISREKGGTVVVWFGCCLQFRHTASLSGSTPQAERP